MAKNVDDQGRPIISRGPRQASRIFGFDQDSFLGSPGGATTGAPRPKFLFIVRFIRGALSGSAKWKDGLSFAVRSCDRPKVMPQVQELNQYNKKRQVHTGIKFGSVNIEFHDTVDAVVSTMWAEYANYHYGDFRKKNDIDWKYDVTNSEFRDSGGGFGYALPPGGSFDVTEGGYFFEKVQCFQFFGGQYTQYDLIHPRISGFDPDAMDYESETSHVIRMSLDYETVIYHNNFVPAPVTNSSELTTLLGGLLDGDVYEPPREYERTIFQGMGSSLGALNSIIPSVGRILRNENLAGTQIIPDQVTKGLGVLSTFGVFDFGGGVKQILSPVTGAIGNVIGVDTSSFGTMGVKSTGTRGISSAKFDVAAGQAQQQLISGAPTQAGQAAAQFLANATGTSATTASNDFRSPTSQIGTRISSSSEPPLA